VQIVVYQFYARARARAYVCNNCTLQKYNISIEKIIERDTVHTKDLFITIITIPSRTFYHTLSLRYSWLVDDEGSCRIIVTIIVRESITSNRFFFFLIRPTVYTTVVKTFCGRTFQTWGNYETHNSRSRWSIINKPDGSRFDRGKSELFQQLQDVCEV
jgi:hypothetical protein